MAKEDVTFDFSITCDICCGKLECDVVQEYDQIFITVEPCLTCMMEEREAGRRFSDNSG